MSTVYGAVWLFPQISIGAAYLQALDGQPQHAGRQPGGLFEGEVAPVDDEDEAVDLKLWVFDHSFQRQQDGSQYVHKRVPKERDERVDY